MRVRCKHILLLSYIFLLLMVSLSMPVLADENTPVSMTFKGADIRDVLRILAELADVNLIVHQNVQGEITLSLKQVPFHEAIELLTLMQDLESRWVGKTLFVSTPKKIEESFAETSVQSFAIEYAALDKLKEILENILVGTKVSIDSRTRTLVVLGEKSQLQRAETVIENLDKPIPQVYLDVQVNEVSTTALSQLGIPSGNDARIKFITDSNKVITDVVIQLPEIIEALKKDGNAKTLANPGLMALDGEVAKLLIGDKIPVEAEETVDGKTRTVIKYIEAGISLEFTPRVSKDGYITLDVKPQISSLGESLTKGYPIIRTREVQTMVRIKDGETFVIAGLIREDDRVNTEKVPILGDIPILKILFSRKDSDKQGTEVVIIITPRILYPENQVKQTAERERTSAESVKLEEEQLIGK